MSWQPHQTFELLAWMKFAVRGTLALVGLILALDLLYFAARFSWRFLEFLENTIFANQW